MKTIHYLLILTFLLSVSACQDEDYMSMNIPGNDPSTGTRATPAKESALVQNTDGTWKANRRVPLVGKGRIVDNFSSALISVVGWQANIAHLTDINISNTASFAGVATAEVLENQLASVRDMTRTYAGGQTAGFVYKINNTSLLTLTVLKGFWIETFYKGKSQEKKGGSTSGETLELNLLSIANNDGKQALSLSTSFDKPFDEIRIGLAGVDATVLGSLDLYYAFVGDNPEETCTTNNTTYFPDGVEIHKDGLLDLGWTSLLGTDKIIDSNLDNGAPVILNGYVTVNFKKEIPAGTEVGFTMTEASVLNVGLLSGTIVQTYNADSKKVDEVKITNLLGISALGGGKKQVSLVTTNPCTQVRIKISGLNLNLGTTIVNYAYVREPVEVDASSYFSLDNARITGTTYRFSKPAEATNMTCTPMEQPEGANVKVTDNVVAGMTVDGNYVFNVSCTIGEQIYSQSVTITRTTQTMTGTECNTVIKNTPDNTNYVNIYIPSGSAGALTLDRIENENYIIDNNEDNYATYLDPIQLLSSTSIIGINTVNGSPINSAGRNVRVGFSIQPTNTLLNLNALSAFRIRLKNNGAYIKGGSLADENDIVSAGLIGDEGGKIRLSITTSAQFDAIELWATGVAGISLSSFRIYNVFWEPTASNCYSGNAGDACLELVTAANHGAEINYDVTKISALASIGSSFNNLGNLLDNDRASAAEITKTTVAGAVTVGVKFNPIGKGTQVGFMMKKISGLADVDLIKLAEVAAYSKNVKDNGAEISWGIVGADIIGYGDYTYISTITSITDVDEVRITFTNVAGLLGNVLLSGVYIRPDTDGDGVPDCAEEISENNINPITDAKAKSENICQGSPAEIVLAGTNLPTGNYTLQFTDITGTNSVTDRPIALSVDNTLNVDKLPAGNYYINVTSMTNSNAYYNGVHVTVHPSETTWKTSPADTDWNNWSNWTNGTPWDCTNVIIPAGCAFYPQLKAGVDNYCQYIHFEHGGEVVNTHHLKYQKAWVELSLEPGRYYMLSAPLKSMMTGDLFIPASLQGNQGTVPKFTVLNNASSPENRFSPRIYQRFWSSNATGKNISGGTLTEITVAPDKTNWTAPFNALNSTYQPGMGFSVRAEKESLGTLPNGKLTFRFPKEHTEYTYFNAGGTSTGQTETIARASAGRFIYENAGGTAALPLNVTATNIQAGSTFLVGNPFMAHIDIQKFLEINTNINAIKVYDGNKNNSMILANGELLSNGDAYRYIAPMQSFFVTAAQGTTVTARFTEDMLLQVPGNTTRTITRGATNTQPKGTLQLTATAPGGIRSTAVLRLSPQANDTYRADEDVKSLFDSEVQPALSVFTEAGGNALDIQQINGNHIREIPIGFSLKSATNVQLILTADAGNAWQGWSLEDRLTGKLYPISTTGVHIDLGHISTHIGRLYLVKRTK